MSLSGHAPYTPVMLSGSTTRRTYVAVDPSAPAAAKAASASLAASRAEAANPDPAEHQVAAAQNHGPSGCEPCTDR